MSGSNDVLVDETPTIAETTRVWWKIGILSFGGPAAQIALMHKEVVEDRNWLSEQQFLNALSFCMLLPGPEAMQLATYAGWRLHGTLGGLIAGLLFVLPGAAVIMSLATIYSIYGDVPLVEALFYGIKAAVLVIVVEALLRVAKKALSQRVHWLIAALAFVGIFFLSIPYPLIVLMAGLFGWFMGTAGMDRQPVDMAHVSAGKTGLMIATWLAIWLLPLLALGWLGAPGILVEVGRFFSMLAVVTFGGAYAVLAYMAQDVVVQFGWLTAGEMVDALGLAETTPGPPYPGHAICRVSRRFQGRWISAWPECCRGGAMGHLRPVLSLDFRWRTLHRMDIEPTTTERCSQGNHRCRRGGHPKSFDLVCTACPVFWREPAEAGTHNALAAGPCNHRMARRSPVPHQRLPDLPVALGYHQDSIGCVASWSWFEAVPLRSTRRT